MNTLLDETTQQKIDAYKPGDDITPELEQMLPEHKKIEKFAYDISHKIGIKNTHKLSKKDKKTKKGIPPYKKVAAIKNLTLKVAIAAGIAFYFREFLINGSIKTINFLSSVVMPPVLIGGAIGGAVFGIKEGIVRPLVKCKYKKEMSNHAPKPYKTSEQHIADKKKAALSLRRKTPSQSSISWNHLALNEDVPVKKQTKKLEKALQFFQEERNIITNQLTALEQERAAFFMEANLVQQQNNELNWFENNTTNKEPPYFFPFMVNCYNAARTDIRIKTGKTINKHVQNIKNSSIDISHHHQAIDGRIKQFAERQVAFTTFVTTVQQRARATVEHSELIAQYRASVEQALTPLPIWNITKHREHNERTLHSGWKPA